MYTLYSTYKELILHLFLENSFIFNFVYYLRGRHIYTQTQMYTEADGKIYRALPPAVLLHK